MPSLGLDKYGKARLVTVRRGEAGKECMGLVWSSWSCRETSWQAGLVPANCGSLCTGGTRKGRYGGKRPGLVRQGT